MAHTVPELLTGILAEARVRQIYGVVGDSLSPLTDAVRRSAMKWVDVRHKESGAFAAEAPSA